jgi:hypothetical protein
MFGAAGLLADGISQCGAQATELRLIENDMGRRRLRLWHYFRLSK